MDRNELMRKAIQMAAENVQSGAGGPFAALIVKDGAIIATGANCVTSTNDPTAHAEIVAIRKACTALGHFHLGGCEIYSTCEPCPMCLGAIYWARLARVYFAALEEDAARAGFDDAAIRGQMRLPYEKQAMPIQRLLQEEANGLLPFRIWRAKADKILY
jgi:guanine deaminase